MIIRRVLTAALSLVAAAALAASAPAMPAKKPQLNDRVETGISQVATPVASDHSSELRSYTPKVTSTPGPDREMPSPVRSGAFPGAVQAPDGALQSTPGAEGVMPAPAVTFEGGSNAENGSLFGFLIVPPDTNGDVGPNHYVQTVNGHFSVYTKAGARLYGPAPVNTVWTGFGGACETRNDGHPIVLYDSLADRWVISQFANADNYYQCIAVSQTADPLGAYNRYSFNWGNQVFRDSPKMSVWWNAYFLTVNEYDSFGLRGSGFVAFQRDRMLTGLPLPYSFYWRFENPKTGLPSPNPYYYSLVNSFLPADLDGPPPPAGAMAMFVNVSDNTNNSFGVDVMLPLWLDVDWTGTIPGKNVLYGNWWAVPAFNVLCPSSQNCIPQPGTGQKLDALSDRAMYRAVYRNFGTHQVMLFNHTVDAGGGVAGIRWYEFRYPSSGPWPGYQGSIYQASTYAPADGTSRWMGSIAMDGEGGIALGYSASSASVSPSIRYAGRLANDTLNTFGQTETTLQAGGGSQLGTNRWGTYSSMSIDPSDDCTFWYTQEYYGSSSNGSWNTRVGAFKFPTCVTSARGTIQGTVTSSGMPVQGVLVTVGSFSTSTDASGFYKLPNVPAGSYSASAAKYGYNTATASPSVTNGGTTVQNFTLTAAATVRVEGYVTDGTAHNWGVYAKVRINAGGLVPSLYTYTDPLTGYYRMDVVPAPAGFPYWFYFEPVYPGYNTEVRPALAIAANTVLNVQLSARASECAAPGYTKSAVTPLLSENFDSTAPGSVPAGWTATSSSPTYPWQVQSPAGTVFGQAPLSAPNYLWFDSWNSPSGTTARIFRTNPVNLTGKGATLSFYMYHDTLIGGLDRVQVQVSTDAGATWQNIDAPIYRYIGTSGWQQHSVYLDNYTGNSAAVLIGLQAISSYGNEILIDNVSFSTHVCSPVQGGLVVGNVYDANTGAPLNEALVSHDLGGSATTFSTPMDTAQDDGFYFLFAPIPGVPPAARNLTASKSSYNSSSTTVILPADGVIRQNFQLTAGAFLLSPSEIRLRVNAGQSGSAPLVLQNGGTASSTFTVNERIVPPATYLPGVRPYGATSFRAAERVTLSNPELASAAGVTMAKNESSYSLDAAGLGPAFPGVRREQPLLVACDEMGYYAFGGLTNTVNGSEVKGDAYRFNAATGTWESLPAMPVPLFQHTGGCINGMIYIAGGISTGSAATNVFLTFDTITRKWTTSTIPAVRWAMEGAVVDGKLYLVGGMDASFVMQTGVWMFDPSTGTFSVKAAMPAGRYKGSATAIGSYVYFTGGGYPDVFRYDTVANSWSTGPAMPQARQWHGAFSYGGYVYVVGGLTGNIFEPTTIRYNPAGWPAGSWSVVPTAVPPVAVIAAGHVATNNKLFLVAGYTGSGYTTAHQFIDDGLTTWQAADELPYMTETPSSGTVGAGSSQVIAVNFNTTTSTKFGLHAAQLVVTNNTPYGPQAVGTLLTKAFLDVPEGAFGDKEIHGLAGARITYGVAGNNYAPNNSVSRAEMAIFLTRATQGYAFIPPFPGPGLNSFTDVTYDHWAANYIEFIYNPAAHGAINPIPQLTTGCSASPLMYCPEKPTTRGEMAVFVTRAAFGGSQYLNATPVFGDVPAGHPYRGFIERIWKEGVTSGCGGGNFCPDRAITRAEMAIFLVRAFNIPYLH